MIDQTTKPQPTFGVIGGGSWATAIVKILCETQECVGWYMRNTAAIEHITTENHNPNYLSSVEFNTDQLLMSDDINEIVACTQTIIFAIPSAFIESELQKITVSLKNKGFFSAIKGIVPQSNLIVGEHLNSRYQIPMDCIGVVTGPCHAEEVALERLSYLTIACMDSARAIQLSNAMSCAYIKCTTSDDIIGTEYAAMLKNIYALAAGIAHGLGYGDNFQSVLMSNAIREMKRYVKKVHHMKRNINGSAYLGDLLVTGYSLFSRNRMFGTMIGKGYTVKSTMMEMNMVAEGYYAVNSAYQLNENKGSKKAKTPIIDAVYNILYQGKSPKQVFKKLVDKLD
ncbi:MAG: glycerol-3-phosphate dehydrogenase [Flavobacteriaceae bacterium]|nr:glycerol-3-phosphate dehydrogenase [Flavobacteriaceae bacterium]MDG1962671.1 glycerol-3-phosphate dehydrogenase [Flavobacteriaceae bacterium]